MASRNPVDLVPELKTKALSFIEDCEKHGIDLVITCTLRSFEEQARLYRQGRSLAEIQRKIESLKAAGKSDMAAYITKVGPQKSTQKVTNAAPGESMHNWGKAFDVVPVENGKCIWGNDLLWTQIGEIGIAHGLEWGGFWHSIIDKPHFQLKE